MGGGAPRAYWKGKREEGDDVGAIERRSSAAEVRLAQHPGDPPTSFEEYERRALPPPLPPPVSPPPGGTVVVPWGQPPDAPPPALPPPGGTPGVAPPPPGGGRIGTRAGSVAYLPQTGTLDGLGGAAVAAVALEAGGALPPGAARTVAVEVFSAADGAEPDTLTAALGARSRAPGLRVEAWMSGFAPLPGSPLHEVARQAGAILGQRADGTGRSVIDLTHPAVMDHLKRSVAGLRGADAISADDHFSVPPEARGAFLARHPVPPGFPGTPDAWVQRLMGGALAELAGAARATGAPFTLSIGGGMAYFKQRFGIDAPALVRARAIDQLELQVYRSSPGDFAAEMEATKRAVLADLDAFRALPGGLRIAVSSVANGRAADPALMRFQEQQVAELDRWLRAQGVSGGATIAYWDAARYPR